MAREKFLEISRNKEGFAVVPGKVATSFPEGVSARMLWDLWDIGSKFGQEIGKWLGFKTQVLFMELYDLRDGATEGCILFVVGKAEEAIPLEQGLFIFELKNGIKVFWDKGITPEETTLAIQKIDDYALSKHLIVDGSRMVFERSSGGKNSG